MHSVFISYARRTSASAARALHAALGNEAFFDQDDIEPGERFPARIVDALLMSKVVVVFPDQAYFDRMHCRWELKTALEPFNRSAAAGSERVSHLIVVLPPGARPSELDRFPAEIQTTSWSSADDTGAVVTLVRRQLEASRLTLGARYAAIGQPEEVARARLLELSANRAPESLAGIRKFPSQLPPSKGDRFVGRANDLWRIDFALGTLRGSSAAAALTGAIEGTGGVGKTQLALEYVHRFGRLRFPDGIFWVDAEEELEAQHHGILRTIDPAVPDLPTFRKVQRSAYAEMAEALDRAADGADILFVVDNVPESSSEPLSKWCPALNKVTALATSRSQLSAVESAVPVPVGVLGPDAAVQLLTSGLNAPAPAAESLLVAEWVGRLPLALTVLNAALRLKGTTIERLADKARSRASQTAEVDGHMRALRGRVPEGALRGVTEAFAESYHLLSEEAQQGARLLARLAPSAIPIHVVDALELSPAARMSLMGCSFVTEDESTGKPSVPTLGSMHRVLADYLRTLSQDSEGERERLHRVLASLLAGLSDSPRQWRVMQACVPHAEHVLRTSAGLRDGRNGSIARLALVLGQCLIELDRPQEGAAVAKNAVEMYRALAEASPELFLPDLARAINNLAIVLADLGRREGSVRAAEEAVAIRRALAARSPDAFLPDLAVSLYTASGCMADLGRREEGLRLVSEAVEIRRKLAAAKPEVFLSELAKSLNGLAGRLGALGMIEEALKAAQESVVIRRSLVGREPEEHLPALARSMHSLAACLGELGREHEGLHAIQEAVQLYRDLVRQRPEAFLPDLAGALDLLCACLSRQGRHEDGLRAAEEAVAIYDELAKQRPEAFLPGLAGALINLSVDLTVLGRTKEGVAACQKAIDVYRDLAKESPQAFSEELAMSLHNLSVDLGGLGRKEAALQASQEAVGLFRELAKQSPKAFLPRLAKCLRALSRFLVELKRSEDARAAADESRTIQARLDTSS